MPSIIECVPNFSEGRDPAVLSRLAQAARSVPGAALLDIHTDADHNRSVFTLTGSPDAIAEAAFLLAEIAVTHIDLTRHTGAHPRMGAVDVIPFIPIANASMQDCVRLSCALGQRLGESLGLPVFLYEQAAVQPSRVNLADIRRGGFEGMPQKLALPEWTPDYGPPQRHPTAGVTAVGARKPLIAFNLRLDTPTVSIAKAVAKSVRASSGGLPCVKAIGLYLRQHKAAQVSINLTDYTQTSLYQVFTQVAAEAAKHGARVVSSELVGLAPMRAFTDCAAHFLRLTEYDPARQILEQQIENTKLTT